MTPDESIVQPKPPRAQKRSAPGTYQLPVTSRGQGAPATFLFWRLTWALGLAETLLKDVISLNLLTGTGGTWTAPEHGPAEVG